MQARLQNLNSPCDSQKIDVEVESCGDGQQVVLRYSTWTDGLGWCGQKTIRVDEEHLDDLHRALTVARHRIARNRVVSGEVVEPARVIHLPTIA